jgi:CRISPR-associated protein Cas1
LTRIICTQDVLLSSRLLRHCHSEGIDLVFLHGRIPEDAVTVMAPQGDHAERRLTQYRLACDPLGCLPLARLLVAAKARHSYPCCPGEARGALASLRQSADLAGLRGVEGALQRALFAYWRQQLPASAGFSRRQRRPPPDPVNALLSLTSTLLVTEARKQCLAAGLDPMLGVYHQPVRNRPSLACDLIEPLRPQAEAWVVALWQQGMLSRRHFREGVRGVMLGGQGRQQYYRAWHGQLAHFQVQLRWLARFMARQVDHYGRQGGSHVVADRL